MVFGAIVLIFSLFYFSRYAKTNFNEMIENESSKNLLNKDIKDDDLKSLKSVTTSHI